METEMRLPQLKLLPERLLQLKALSLFSTLDARELRIVDDLLHERRYQEGEVIFDEGEEGHAIYFVFEGEVTICRQGQPENGRIAEVGPGDFFGDLALLDNSPRAAQARAAAACRLGVFFRTDFQGLLETNARLASNLSLQLARHLGARLRERAHGWRGEQYL
jgi:CRP/FNR family cyclic AMP-dependent transcriptional regulator